MEDDYFSDDSDAPGIDDEEDEDFDEEIIPVAGMFRYIIF